MHGSTFKAEFNTGYILEANILDIARLKQYRKRWVNILAVFAGIRPPPPPTNCLILKEFGRF